MHILERWSESIEFLKKAVELRPDFSEAYYLLGYAYEMLDQTDEAVTWYRTCIEQHPTHSNALIALEQLYSSMGQTQPAREVHDREHVLYASEMMGARHPFSTKEVYLWSNFQVSKRCRFLRGSVVFNIVAKATSYFQEQAGEVPDFDPSAHIVIRLNDVNIGEADVPIGEWTTHPFVTYVDSGLQNLTIAFTNDVYNAAEKKDRNLIIAVVGIRNKRFE